MSKQPLKFSEKEIPSQLLEPASVSETNQQLSAVDTEPKDSSEAELVKKAPKSSKASRWFWVSFSVLVLSASSYELYLFIDEIFAFSKLLGYFLLGITGVLLASFGKILLKGFRASKKVKSRQRQRLQLAQLADNKTFGQANAHLTAISQEIEQQVDISAHIETYLATFKPSHNDQELIQIYESSVLTRLDQEATKIISKHSSETALWVALSPLATLDMLLVAWRSSKMIAEVSSLYGCPQGLLSRLDLTRSVLKSLMLTGAGELIADAGVELLGGSLSAKISAKAAQGIGVGLLISRLGIEAMQESRPLEFNQETRPRIKDMRKLLVKTIVEKISNKPEK